MPVHIKFDGECENIPEYFRVENDKAMLQGHLLEKEAEISNLNGFVLNKQLPNFDKLTAVNVESKAVDKVKLEFTDSFDTITYWSYKPGDTREKMKWKDWIDVSKCLHE